MLQVNDSSAWRVCRLALSAALALIVAPSPGLAACPVGDLGACTAACNAGDAESCARLGAIYMRGGSGVARDDRRAVQLLRRACDGGSGEGCTNLRRMRSQGRGVGRHYDTEDAARARALCDAGGAAACLDLGRMYEHGRGVARDPGQAVERYRLACRAGSAAGCRRACAAGDAASCAPARPPLP
jgi:TPR repeat protein